MIFGFKSRAAACLLAMAFTLALCMPLISARGAEETDVLRLHILANSDSAADQRVKLLVRDAVLTQMKAGETAAETERLLLQNGRELLAAAEAVLRENGFSYGVQLMLGTYAFPTRVYGEKTYPAGDYRALRIVLGQGRGQNWWCVLFPPLCIVTRDGASVPKDGEIRFESSILRFLRSLEVFS